ncbi:hypothetical protein K9M48_03855 [Candidatus Gracilibacteria bacterium]|nr:hypothetical protein [Candidatus Gracilibacteria bacterium]
MKILIDQNNLLTIENPNIPKLKEYSNIASGYNFSDYDKGIIVYHKKQIKIINLKNLGDTMNVFWIKKRKPFIENKLDEDGFESAFGLFNGFDENTGKKYFFIPKIKESEFEILKKKLHKLAVDINLEKNEKGVCVSSLSDGDNKIPSAIINNGITSIFSFLFGLVLIYGKMDIKNGDLVSIKIHIPLFGQYIKYKEELDSLLKFLQEDGIFISRSIVQNKDGITYQISSSDYEFLGSLAYFYQSIEKIQKILKQETTENIKSELINFLEINDLIPEDGKEDVIAMIEDGIVKILTV